MLRTRAYCLLTLLLLFPTSCATGERYTYQETSLNLPEVGSQRLALTVVDQRPDVLNQRYPQSYVGSTQTNPGELEVVLTDSGSAFAADVATVLQGALARSGYQVTLANSTPGISRERAFQTLRELGTQHLLVFEIEQWQTRTFKNMQLDDSLVLSIFNASGALQGQARVKGSDQLEATSDDSQTKQSNLATQALAHKLGMVFNDPKVVSAFRRDL